MVPDDSSGTLSFLGLAARQGDGGPVGPGRWCVSPLTTVPLVSIETGMKGPRLLTWGQVLEVPEGAQGKVRNPCWHAGDVWLDGIGSGAGHSGLVPRQVTVAVDITLVPGPRPLTGYFRTSTIDTRFARSAHLVWEPPGGVDGAFDYRVNYGAPSRSKNYTGTSAATAGSEWKTEQSVVGFLGVLPLGFHAGQNLEPAPGLRSLADPRAHALWEYCYARWDESAGVEIHLEVGRSLWCVLEY